MGQVTQQRSVELVRGARYLNTRGDHKGNVVVVVSYSPANVRFTYARKTRKTDSERLHRLTRNQFERDYVPA